MLLGYARGSIGDVTFSRSKGQQVARARNRKPNNPRSAAQMEQRSIFIDAVKFYTRGVQNLFKFAYEGKRAEESDYNAFMRINAKSGMYLKKDDFDNPFYPALGNWTVSQGSLEPLRPTLPTGAKAVSLNVSWAESEVYTVKSLSQGLINGGGYMEGDILTFVMIDTDSIVESDAVEPIAVSVESGTRWTIKQVILSLADTSNVDETGLIVNSDGSLYLQIGSAPSSSDIYCGFVIHSRKTSEGLKVSTQQILNSPAAKTAISRGVGDTWKDIVIADWDARAEAILEGGA